MSLGAAVALPEESFEAVLRRAEHGLRAAKAKGRNPVELAE